MKNRQSKNIIQSMLLFSSSGGGEICVFDKKNHDTFFNHKDKALYESKLAALVIKHKQCFMEIIHKVSQLIKPDFEILSQETIHPIDSSNICSVTEKFHLNLTNAVALKTLYPNSLENSRTFYDEVTHDLNSQDEETFFKQLALYRAYLTFFIEKGQKKPTLDQAIRDHWCKIIDLTKLLDDVKKLRGEWFRGIVRKTHRTQFVNNKNSENIGILPPESYQELSLEDQKTLTKCVPKHEVGGYLYFITTKGEFTHQGAFIFDMPQLCGPSGMTALYLALANQANLTEDERFLFDFFISLYTVAFGGHSIDECFVIGSHADIPFNHYERGNYQSIISDNILKKPQFKFLWEDIQKLNKAFEGILLSNSIKKEHKYVSKTFS